MRGALFSRGSNAKNLLADTDLRPAGRGCNRPVPVRVLVLCVAGDRSEAQPFKSDARAVRARPAVSSTRSLARNAGFHPVLIGPRDNRVGRPYSVEELTAALILIVWAIGETLP